MSRERVIVAVIILAIFATSVANAGSGFKPMPTIPLYRYWNGDMFDHFYTTNWDELGDGGSGYSYEGVAGYVYPEPLPDLPFDPSDLGLEPLYRYWSGSDHFYTTNWDELGGGRDGWSYEGIACWIYSAEVDSTEVRNMLSEYYSDVPRLYKLHRYYNGGGSDHFYTTNWNELGDGGDGWSYEGIAGYVHRSRPIEG